MWFDDAGKVVVCTHGFLKDQPKTDPTEIKLARTLRTDYFAAKQRGPLGITESED
jgi:hypothetical protein